MGCPRIAPTVVLIIGTWLAPPSLGAQTRSSAPPETRAIKGQDDKAKDNAKDKDKARHNDETAKGNDKDQPEVRRALIRRAQIWSPTDISKLDIRRGPAEPNGFPVLATVSCDHRDEELSGGSPKFSCRISPEDDVKVKYGGDNGEVYGEVAATRLLWALGFGADRMYPVKVVCRGCPAFPGAVERLKGGAYLLDPATVERKLPGREIQEQKGWAWPELDEVNERAGGATRAERDALKLLAVFLQHSDNKPVQQRLLCLDDPAPKHDAECRRPFMMINDVGLTFGRVSRFNSNEASGVNLKAWSSTPVWKVIKDGPETQCVGNLPRSATGSLEDPVISEAGRRMLAGLLQRLTDDQLHDLFDVARFQLRVRDPGDARSGLATIDEWVRAFKDKREQVAQRRCES